MIKKIRREIFKTGRRNFIKTASVGTLAAIGIPQIVSAALATEKSASKLKFNAGDVILFQGDSITDWGRDHSKTEPNTTSALGSGYTLITASKLLLDHADKDLKIYNKGISGNKVYQLADRWDTDCLALKPNILSIHIGVNDFWHTLTGGYKGTIETYVEDYKKLLTRTKQALPDVKLVICEPFASKGVKAVDEKWYPAFAQYSKAARDIAHEFGAVFVPYQAAFDKAIETVPAAYWSIDGVHPSVAGEALMAQTWLKAVGA
ncbi:SGNH/GDSL hydrolase family protein [Mucilaginibacter sp. SP1R1]|uniref:SGNH/GDSL hydrolase family protein n=1 Tax=Mucilaginibacter sp. SP1R1 TaxID=2723091 RepID=UPI00161AE355|nr:SGNH/GDSL hydrolase family protein [Mucilaginibacter sp. SP1R1]MBB6151197.1 lysophospholipase L1-like esterase [Mucilaginibacter sp. SP1R1]